MKDRNLGAREAVVADRTHARHAARRRRQHGVRTDATHRVAHQQFGVAALAAGKPGCEQILPVADLVIDARGRHVTQRPGRTGRHAGRRAVAHIAFGDASVRCIACDAGISATYGAEQTIDAFGAIPCDHAGFRILGERAGRAYRDAFRIAALAAHRQFKSAFRRHDLDARTRDIVCTGLGRCAGAHTFGAPVALGGVESDSGVSVSHDHFHKRDMNSRPVVSGSTTRRSSAAEMSTRRRINCRITPPSKNSLTPNTPCSRPSLTTTRR